MADQTNIEWCDSTFNPWIGCTRVSPACDDCYAARSTPARTLGVVWGPGEPRRRTGADNWAKPTQWNARGFYACANCGSRNEGRDGTDRDGALTWVCRSCGSERLQRVRRRVFCASLADVFDNEVPDEWRVDLFKLIAATPDLDWLLVTKRIGNVARMLGDHPSVPLLPNIWLGITVCNQEEFDRDFPKLQRVPAAVRFLSVEPMLGPINASNGSRRSDGVASLGRPALEGLHWVICGGESGPKARPMHPDWARSLRDQCEAAGVPFLFKQWGEWVPADDDCGTVVPVTEIVGDVQWQEGKRVQVQWLSPNDSIVGHSFARLGKKAAGRLLDGRTHDGFPGGAS